MADVALLMRGQDPDARWHVYGLLDPRSHQIRYVGCTSMLHARYRGHCTTYPASVSDGYRSWRDELFVEGMVPQIVVLEPVYSEPHAAELFWICCFRASGAELLNVYSPDGLPHLSRLSRVPTPAPPSPPKGTCNPQQVEIEALVANSRSEGMTLRAICDLLTERGFVPRGYKWHAQTIANMMAAVGKPGRPPLEATHA